MLPAQDQLIAFWPIEVFYQVPLYHLAPLSEDEKDVYRAAFAHEEEYSDYQPVFISCALEPSSDASSDDDISTMYNIWKSHGDKSATYQHFMFFIDQRSLFHASAVVIQQDIPTLCHYPGSSQWAEDLLDEELRLTLDAYLSAKLAKSQEAGHFTHTSHREYVSLWLGEVLADVYSAHGHLLSQRGVIYGRIPATGVASTYCNLDGSNMDMSQLVEYFGRNDEVSDEGAVYQYLTRNWDESAFAQVWSNTVKEQIESGTEHIESPKRPITLA